MPRLVYLCRKLKLYHTDNEDYQRCLGRGLTLARFAGYKDLVGNRAEDRLKKRRWRLGARQIGYSRGNKDLSNVLQMIDVIFMTMDVGKAEERRGGTFFCRE